MCIRDSKIDPLGNATYFEWRDRVLYPVDKLSDDTRIELKIDGNAFAMLASEANKHHYTLWRPWIRQKWDTPVPAEVIDVVKKPSHYQLIEGVEVIEIIASSMTEEAFKGYCLGNMIKYRLRCGKKDDITQEIGKADFYGELYDKHKHLCRK